MKKLQLILWLLLTLLIYSSDLLGQCYNCNMYAADPKQPWKRSLLYIDNVSMVIKPAGKFYQVDLYMNYHVTEPQKFSDLDTLEIVHYFSLSKNVAVTDSWLWVGDVIMQADILERNAAYNIYEGIVNRRKDPSVLYKYDYKNYEYRIFPLPAKETRRVKLSFLVASDEKDQIEMPLGMFNDSHPKPDINVIHYEKDSKLTPVLSNGVVFTEGLHPEYGAYKKAVLKGTAYDLSDGEHSGVDFHLEQPESHLFLSALPGEGGEKDGIFQLSIDPSRLMGLDTLDKNKIVFVLDYQSGNNLFAKAEILDALKAQIKSMVKSGDTFRILYNHLTVREVSTDWLDYEDLANLDTLLAGIELGNSSLISTMLYEAYSRVRDEKSGLVFLLSSADDIVTPAEAQSLKDELLAQLGVLRQTIIVDFSTFTADTKSTFYNGSFYYGNELLYKILSTNTRGEYVTMKFEAQKAKIFTLMEELTRGLVASRFDFIDYNIRPDGGISFDVYPIKYGSRTLQVGKFRGDLPFTLEVTAIYNDSLIFNTYTIDNDTTVQDIKIYKQCQAMGKILDLESIQGTTNDHLFALAQTSIESRVLSKQTAFLALEPGMQPPCMDCEDESIGTVGVIDKELKAWITAAPNPFINTLRIHLKGYDDTNDVERTELIDLTGRVTLLDLTWNRAEDGLSAEWDGSDLQSGIYILRITVKGKVYIVKIVKA